MRPVACRGAGNAGGDRDLRTDWLTYHGDYSARRHSALNQITPANAKSLVAKWVFHIDGAKKLEATPIVHGGLMYISNTNEMYALDARNGRKVSALPRL